ncbi:myoD family inhibitor domain-containing protein 2 [Astyanax mexicanus]|uniref:MyoD family inhibitor domain containing 2 n=1 Tax=Astyanax mexicanus TaxID=7994 RepID=A0A3B1JSF2_ASTMX|nr:myoD family inhibitor domain-containing protein 2 [Astyanax mexicanus]
MMAGKKARRDEMQKLELISTEERVSLVGSDSPGQKVMDSAPERTLHRLSTISEHDSDNKADPGPAGPSFSLCSVDKYSIDSSSTSSLSDSQDADDACAGIVLNCLFCRFYDLCVMLPETCERAVSHVCPAYQYLVAPLEPVQSSDWNCNCDFDCGLFDACQETSECLELAMELSEICYR